ncbi:hypothetical protein R50073_33540 [Maricurvus nonylphenolicus]
MALKDIVANRPHTMGRVIRYNMGPSGPSVNDGGAVTAWDTAIS